jgi:hypothetical protein
MKFDFFSRGRALAAGLPAAAALTFSLFALSGSVANAGVGGDYAEPLPAPKTKITAKPKKRTKARTATFRFKADQRASTFTCKLDRARWKPCRSPLKVKKLKPGKHTFKVRATYEKTDKSPAVFRWTVKKK